MDVHFATSVLLMVLMFLFVIYSAGDKKGLLDRVALGIVREHNSPHVLLGIAVVSMGSFIITLAILAILVFTGDIYEPGYVWKNLVLAGVDVCIALLAGWFIRLWDHAVSKREWYLTVNGTSSRTQEALSRHTHEAATLLRNVSLLFLSGAITGVFPGIVLSKPSVEIAEKTSDAFDRSSLLLFALGCISMTASFVVGFWGSLLVFAYASQIVEPWEYVSVWFAWAGVSSISLVTFEIARSAFRKGRSRMSDYIGETFGW